MMFLRQIVRLNFSESNVIRSKISCRRKYATKAVVREDFYDKERPIKYSTSEVANWKAAWSRYGGKTPPREESISDILIQFFSVLGFVVYMIWYRPPNDLDIHLDMTLAGRILKFREETLLEKRKEFIRKRLPHDKIDEEIRKIRNHKEYQRGF